MRRHVFFRDDGVCASCKYQHFYLDGDWEADHINPLMISLGDPKFWNPENVRVLCKTPCHAVKSALDRQRYRKKDRLMLKKRYEDLDAME